MPYQREHVRPRTGARSVAGGLIGDASALFSVQQQVFRRYFSTKGEDRGLGTWDMRLLAKEYLGGSVSFSSTKDGGTTFTLALPLKPKDF
jgi:hypothetical protein